MFKMAMGQAEGVDPEKTAKKALQQALVQLKGLEPQVILVYCDMAFEAEIVLSALQEHCPNSELIGCSVAGAFNSAGAFSEDAITLCALASDRVEMSSGLLDFNIEDIAEHTDQSIRKAKSQLKTPESICLVFPSASHSNFKSYFKSLHDQLAEECLIFGGAASRGPLTKSPPQQYFGLKVYEQAMPYLLLSNLSVVEHGICNSWEPIGPRRKVSEVEGNWIKKIGDQQALSFYQQYLGSHTRPAYEFPLAVYEKNLEDFYLRVPSKYDPEQQAVQFGAEIPEGSEVQLSEARPSQILSQVQEKLKPLSQKFEQDSLAGAFVFSCNARKGILGTRIQDEVEALRQSLPEYTPFIGFYAFAEFGPFQKHFSCRLHHMTMTVLLLSDGTKADYEKVDPLEYDDSHELLHKQLQRTAIYRKSLETVKDNNTELLKNISREIEEAKTKIEHQKQELEKLNSHLEKEKEKSESLLLNILPYEIAEELKSKGEVTPVRYEAATILFTDFKGFTSAANRSTPQAIIEKLDYYFRHFDQIMDRYGLEKLKTIGDSYMCAGGLPKPDEGHTLKMIDAAWEMIEFMKISPPDQDPWQLRVGVHVGPLMAGVIGTKKFAYDIWGDAVNVASRLESHSDPNKINVSREVYEKIDSAYRCHHRGKISVKNRGELEMFFVDSKI